MLLQHLLTLLFITCVAAKDQQIAHHESARLDEITTHAVTKTVYQTSVRRVNRGATQGTRPRTVDSNIKSTAENSEHGARASAPTSNSTDPFALRTYLRDDEGYRTTKAKTSAKPGLSGSNLKTAKLTRSFGVSDEEDGDEAPSEVTTPSFPSTGKTWKPTPSVINVVPDSEDKQIPSYDGSPPITAKPSAPTPMRGSTASKEQNALEDPVATLRPMATKSAPMRHTTAPLRQSTAKLKESGGVEDISSTVDLLSTSEYTHIPSPTLIELGEASVNKDSSTLASRTKAPKPQHKPTSGMATPTELDHALSDPETMSYAFPSAAKATKPSTPAPTPTPPLSLGHISDLLSWDPSCASTMPPLALHTAPPKANDILGCWVAVGEAADKSDMKTEPDQSSAAWGKIEDARLRWTVMCMWGLMGLQVVVGLWEFADGAWGVGHHLPVVGRVGWWDDAIAKAEHGKNQ